MQTLDANADLLLNGGVEAPWGKQFDLLHYADAETGGLHVQRFHGIPIVRRPATTPAGEHQLWRRPESNGRRNQRPRRRPPITAVSSSPPCSVRQTTALHGSCRRHIILLVDGSESTGNGWRPDRGGRIATVPSVGSWQRVRDDRPVLSALHGPRARRQATGDASHEGRSSWMWKTPAPAARPNMRSTACLPAVGRPR